MLSGQSWMQCLIKTPRGAGLNWRILQCNTVGTILTFIKSISHKVNPSLNMLYCVFLTHCHNAGYHVIGKGKDPAVAAPMQANQKYSSWLSTGLRLEQMQYVPLSSLSSQPLTCIQKQSSDLCPQTSAKAIIAQCKSSSQAEG